MNEELNKAEQHTNIQEQLANDQQPPKKEKTGVLVTIIVILVILLGLAVYLLLTQDNNQTPTDNLTEQQNEPTTTTEKTYEKDFIKYTLSSDEFDQKTIASFTINDKSILNKINKTDDIAEIEYEKYDDFVIINISYDTIDMGFIGGSVLIFDNDANLIFDAKTKTNDLTELFPAYSKAYNYNHNNKILTINYEDFSINFDNPTNEKILSDFSNICQVLEKYAKYNIQETYEYYYLGNKQFSDGKLISSTKLLEDEDNKANYKQLCKE